MTFSATSLPNCTMMKPASLSAASSSRPQTGISRMSKIAIATSCSTVCTNAPTIIISRGSPPGG